MAIWIPGPIVSGIRGSIKGVTFSNTVQGMVIKGKPIPIRGNSPKQVASKQIIARTSTAWQALTLPEQVAWNLYAASVSFVNSLGVVYWINGFQMFCRCSAASLSGPNPFTPTLPTQNGLPELPLVGFTYDPMIDSLQVETVTPALATDDQLWGSIYIANKVYSLNPGPRAAAQWGFDGSATLPQTIGFGFSTFLGSGRDMRVFVDWRYRDDDFRISSKQRQAYDFTTA